MAALSLSRRLGRRLCPAQKDVVAASAPGAIDSGSGADSGAGTNAQKTEFDVGRRVCLARGRIAKDSENRQEHVARVDTTSHTESRTSAIKKSGSCNQEGCPKFNVVEKGNVQTNICGLCHFALNSAFRNKITIGGLSDMQDPKRQCVSCGGKAVLKRPRTGKLLCKECFFQSFEQEVHDTIVSNKLFKRGDVVALGASGGKDSTVLASVLNSLNQSRDYGLKLLLLSIDEGIVGYRDDSLETVKRNCQQ